MGLLFRQCQHLPGLEHIALEAVQLHDLGISATFDFILLAVMRRMQYSNSIKRF